MDQITDEQIKINFEELSELKLIYNKKIGLTVFLDNVKYEFILNLEENSDELLVAGSGALGERNFDRSRPYIERHSWNFKRSTIYYHDPTYYVDDEIKAGWCFGTTEDYYLNKISIILNILIEKLDVDYGKVMFYGSSAGGFTSLILATLIKGTMCLVDIPQIYVNKFKSKAKQLDGWKPIKEYFYGNTISDDEFLEMYKYRFNFVEISKKENYVPNAYLILDCSVDLDFNTQYMPFFQELNQLPFNETSNWIKLIITGRNKGHTPVTQNETISLIDKIFNNASYGDDQIGVRFSNSTKSNVGFIVDKLEKYNTARLDVIVGGDDAYLEIVEIDDYVSISKPHWLSDFYSGFIITNKNNSIDFKIRCVGDGDLDIKLRGVDRKYKKQRIPIYINYTKFLVNDKSVMENNNVVFHDKPFIHSKKVKNGEIIKIHVEWLPF